MNAGHIFAVILTFLLLTLSRNLWISEAQCCRIHGSDNLLSVMHILLVVLDRYELLPSPNAVEASRRFVTLQCIGNRARDFGFSIFETRSYGFRIVGSSLSCLDLNLANMLKKKGIQDILIPARTKLQSARKLRKSSRLNSAIISAPNGNRARNMVYSLKLWLLNSTALSKSEIKV